MTDAKQAAEPKQAEPKQDPRDLVLAVLVGALLSPFTGILRALAFRLLWNWFLAPQYGEGPSLRAWFGVGILSALIFFRQGKAEDGHAELPKNVIRRMAEGAFSDLLLLGAAIIAAAMARVVWGWG